MVSVPVNASNGPNDATNASDSSTVPAPLDVRSLVKLYRRNALRIITLGIPTRNRASYLAQAITGPREYGETKTDHMLVATYDPDSGWSALKIQPYQNLQLDPASHCLHYSSNLFEGMKGCIKAYLGPDGTPLLFRPDLNAARMARSAERLALPAPDPDALVILIKKLVSLERRWIPKESGYSLYIRPTLIGTRPAMGVVESRHATLFIIVSPTGPFFKQSGPSAGVKPISLFAAHDLVQAGQMNFFAVIRREDGDLDLVTPPLDGTVLPGVTRQSCLELAQFHNLPPSHASYRCLSGVPNSTKVFPRERNITVEEIMHLNDMGRALEVFGAGTAAVVCPIGRIGYRGSDVVFSTNPSGFGMPIGNKPPKLNGNLTAKYAHLIK
ncbi:hypothetical protein FRC17_001160 [Serendipita sp. 399]|nr:hypothetical protein FRC17_001160 [Serendipita sp. 399]